MSNNNNVQLPYTEALIKMAYHNPSHRAEILDCMRRKEAWKAPTMDGAKKLFQKYKKEHPQTTKRVQDFLGKAKKELGKGKKKVKQLGKDINKKKKQITKEVAKGKKQLSKMIDKAKKEMPRDKKQLKKQLQKAEQGAKNLAKDLVSKGEKGLENLKSRFSKKASAYHTPDQRMLIAKHNMIKSELIRIASQDEKTANILAPIILKDYDLD